MVVEFWVLLLENANSRLRSPSPSHTLRDEQTTRQRVWANDQNWVANHVSGKERMILLFDSTIFQGDCHFMEELFDFAQQINNKQSQRSSAAEKPGTETNSMSYFSLVHAPYPFKHQDLYIFLSPIPIRMSSPNVSLISWITNFGYIETFFTTAKDFLRAGKWNQDFVAPALCHIPLWAARLVTTFVAPAPSHIPMDVVCVSE